MRLDFARVAIAVAMTVTVVAVIASCGSTEDERGARPEAHDADTGETTPEVSTPEANIATEPATSTGSPAVSGVYEGALQRPGALECTGMSADSESDFDGGPHRARGWPEELASALRQYDLPDTGWLEVSRAPEGEMAFVRIEDDRIVAAIQLVDLAGTEGPEAWATSRVQRCLGTSS